MGSLLKKHDFPSSAMVNTLPTNAGDLRDVGLIPGSGRSPEKKMATHSSILAQRLLWTVGPYELQSVVLQRVGVLAIGPPGKSHAQKIFFNFFTY